MPDGSQLALSAPFPYKAGELVERYQSTMGSGQWANFRATMERKRQLFLPDAAPFFVKNLTQGQRDRQTTVDNYGQVAVRTHATFIFGTIVNGDNDWLKISTYGHSGKDDPNTKAWAIEYRNRLMEILMSPECGFVEQFYAMLLERSAFDNGRLYCGDRPGHHPIVKATPMRDACWEGGTGHDPDTHWWAQSLSAAEWAKKFPGKALGETVQKASESQTGRNDQFTFIHGVIDNPGWVPTKPDQEPSERRHLSFWLNEQDKALVTFKWLATNPYEAFRCLRRPGEALGRGPSEEALEETQMAQRVRLGIIRGMEKGIDPTMLLPDDGVITPPTNEPQGAIVLRSDMLTGRGGDPIRYLQSPGRPDLGQEWLDGAIHGAIDRAFSKDLMTLPREPRMLDSQIVGLQEEQARGVVPLMAPIYAPLGRFITRVAAVAHIQGKLPHAPRSAEGLGVAIEFKNPMERAARLAEVRAFMQAIGILVQASQIDPSARHALKVVEGVQWCARVLGVPEQFITDPATLKALIDADTKALAAKAQTEHALDATTGLKNIGAAARGFVTPQQLGGAANAP